MILPDGRISARQLAELTDIGFELICDTAVRVLDELELPLKDYMRTSSDIELPRSIAIIVASIISIKLGFVVANIFDGIDKPREGFFLSPANVYSVTRSKAAELCGISEYQLRLHMKLFKLNHQGALSFREFEDLLSHFARSGRAEAINTLVDVASGYYFDYIKLRCAH